MPNIIEAGHFYSAKGPTRWASVGWRILHKMMRAGDSTLQLIDDVHTLSDVSDQEVDLPTVRFDPDPDHVVYESSLVPHAENVLTALYHLPKRNRPRVNGNGKIYCSGAAVKDADGNPTCVLLDAGLTLMKKGLGFHKGVNILPYFYEEEQRILLRLVQKSIPDFDLTVILYDLDGTHQEM